MGKRRAHSLWGDRAASYLPPILAFFLHLGNGRAEVSTRSPPQLHLRSAKGTVEHG